MALAIAQTMAFAPSSAITSSRTSFKPATLEMNMMPTTTDALLSSSNSIAAATVDPTTALSQVLGGLIGSPAILAVPILAAFSVATVIAWFIVSYANPADPDDD